MQFLKTSPSSFRMNKWYLDCISEAGETFIGYSAELFWKAFKLSYASCLEFDGQQPPMIRTHLLREHLPQLDGKEVFWISSGLSCSGRWQMSLADALPPLTLYRSEQGSVVWHCLQPKTEANIQSAARRVTGLGYVERLELSLLPWHLPMRELHWGRFLSAGVYLVWIIWQDGEHPLRLVYLNGDPVEQITITGIGLSWEGGSLELYDSAVLRDGLLINTALSDIPGIRSLFPQTILHTHERKWRSRGRLSFNGHVHAGWVIHEIVKFQHKNSITTL